MKEEHLLTGSLEPTNEPYAIAKIAGLKLCEAYHSHLEELLSVMPTNLYGIGDNFDLENSHVLPALLRKFHEAKINGAQRSCDVRNQEHRAENSCTRMILPMLAFICSKRKMPIP